MSPTRLGNSPVLFRHSGIAGRKPWCVFSGTRLLREGNYGRFLPTRLGNWPVYVFRHKVIAGGGLWAFFFHTVEKTGQFFFRHQATAGRKLWVCFSDMARKLANFSTTRLVRERHYGRFFPALLRNIMQLASFFWHKAIAEETVGVFFPHG